MTLFGVPVIVTETSLDASPTVVSTVAVLLVLEGSLVEDATVAVFVISPGVEGAVTSIASGAVAPDASPACVHVSVCPAAVQVHPAPVAPTNVTPAGSVSVTVTALEALGPAFATVAEYARAAPAGTGLGEPVIPIERSALACTVVVVVAALLPALGSGVGELTDTVLVTVPAFDGASTTIESGAEAPEARPACEHVTTPALRLHDQPLPVADTNVEPTGTGSVTVTVPDVSGPALLTPTA